MATASRDLRSRVTDVVTCPICLELCNSPKSLPCLHTFCLKCMESYCRDNERGDKVACPVCRKNFKVPRSGVVGLVSNFFIADLVEARKTASDVVGPVPREVCLTEGDHDGGMKGGPHQVVPTGSGDETTMMRERSGKCDKHKNEYVKLFCFNCKLNICLICCAEEHQQHKCKHIDAVAADCVLEIDTVLDTVSKRADGVRNEIVRVDEERRTFLAVVNDVGEKIVARGEELKQLIDKHVIELMAEVQLLKTETCKKIDIDKDNFDMKLVAFETFGAYCSELKTKGKPSDVTRAADDLRVRATELLETDVTIGKYRAPHVMLRETNLIGLLADGNNLIGSLIGHTTDARVVHTLPDAEEVFGVTSLNDELYVMRRTSENQIHVYNTTSYILLRQLSVSALKGMRDMTSCKHYRCLYIADDVSDNVHVYRSELSNKFTKWPVGSRPWGLSVTSQFNVLVTSRDARRLLEFTTDGKQLREINLHADVVSPFHAIKLSNDQVVICHGDVNDPVNRVCIVDTNGHLTQSYGGPPGFASNSAVDGLPLYVPIHVAVDKYGFIYVADLNNNRVLLLSPTLSYVHEVVSSDQLKWKPRRLFLDVDRRRLYVAENELKDGNWTRGRVLVVTVSV